MTRYVASAMDASFRPAEEIDHRYAPRDIDVLETEHEDLRPTGLLDQHGNALFRVQRRAPIGFTHFGGDE